MSQDGQPFLHHKKTANGSTELILGRSFGRTLIALAILAVVLILAIWGALKAPEIMQAIQALHLPFL